MKVGFLGPEGTFSQQASSVYLAKLKRIIEGKIEIVPFTTIYNLLFAIDQGKVKEGVCPIENSIEGTVGVVTDTLVKDVNLRIKQEIILPIYHHLIAQKGVQIKDITDVISHPQALDQCKEFLRKKMPKAKMHLSYSTADAVKQVAYSLGERVISHGKNKGPVFAAIGAIASAKMYGLKVLASKINAADNQTRFVVLAKSDHKQTRLDKTSIVFSVK
ncbi:prephenate dehydratase, partial [Candidatus Margulisiibacteriota bacterium]